jgi:hypothetical protein
VAFGPASIYLALYVLARIDRRQARNGFEIVGIAFVLRRVWAPRFLPEPHRLQESRLRKYFSGV